SPCHESDRAAPRDTDHRAPRRTPASTPNLPTSTASSSFVSSQGKLRRCPLRSLGTPKHLVWTGHAQNCTPIALMTHAVNGVCQCSSGLTPRAFKTYVTASGLTESQYLSPSATRTVPTTPLRNASEP